MNGVIGMLGLLRKSQLAEKQRHFVDIANTSAHSILTIINDILDFYKIEAGKLQLHSVVFDFR
jgi:two-component system sensor histidine kinase/response regulator